MKEHELELCRQYVSDRLNSTGSDSIVIPVVIKYPALQTLAVEVMAISKWCVDHNCSDSPTAAELKDFWESLEKAIDSGTAVEATQRVHTIGG